MVKEDVLDLAALVTERTLKQRWLVDHRITLLDVSNHAGLCGYELWVLKVAGTASFFPSFHITGQSTELRNVGLCACCALPLTVDTQHEISSLPRDFFSHAHAIISLAAMNSRHGVVRTTLIGT